MHQLRKILTGERLASSNGRSESLHCSRAAVSLCQRVSGGLCKQTARGSTSTATMQHQQRACWPDP
jgi:hypothetical protein